MSQPVSCWFLVRWGFGDLCSGDEGVGIQGRAGN